MRILIFDPFSGCAGDMILSALISTGLDFDTLKNELGKLNLSNYDLDLKQVMRQSITAMHLNVITSEENAHRHLKDINEIIDNSDLNNNVKSNAKAIFFRLAQAEAKVHNSSPDKIHFHEVGAVDAIVDIVGAAIGINLLGIEEIYSRPISLGSGFVKAAHGTIPVPSPATSELVKDFPVQYREISSELTTPTGAAIITTLAKPLNSLDKFSIESIGYGAGTKEFEELPNFLRVFIGERIQHYEYDQILKIETNIDDMNPEMFSFLFENLFEMGVKDVFTIPVNMKKNRPGTLLNILCAPENKDSIVDFIFENTTTSGLRFSVMERTKLKRTAQIMKTSFGDINVKIYNISGNRRIIPEYEDLKRLANKHKISIIELEKKLHVELENIKEY